MIINDVFTVLTFYEPIIVYYTRAKINLLFYIYFSRTTVENKGKTIN